MTVTTLRQSPLAWRAVVLLLSTSASWSAGSLLRAEAAEKRTPIAREPKAPRVTSDDDPNNLCHGGMESLANVALIPDAVVQGSGGSGNESVEYHAEIGIRRGQTVGVAWSGEVINDQGRVVQSDIVSGSARASSGDVAVTDAILTDLPDGYYVLQVRAVALQAGLEMDMAVGKQHLLIDRGRWYEVSPDEWRDQSRVRLMQPARGVR